MFRSMPSVSIGRSIPLLRVTRSSVACRCRETSTRWCCSPAAARSTARSITYSRRFPSGPSSSISDTASCRRRRSHMWSRCLRACAGHRITRDDDRSDALYVWLKAFHVIAIIAWTAGMLYLPRLFVYHCEAERGSKQSETFKVMERRLLTIIMNPAMVVSWVLGLWLAWDGSLFGWRWLQAKIVLVLINT